MGENMEDPGTEDMPSEAGNSFESWFLRSQLMEAPPPAYTRFTEFQQQYQPERLPPGTLHPGGFVVPPPPPPLATGAINVPNTTRGPTYPSPNGNSIGGGIQYEVSYAPGTSHGSTGRRPLPLLPGRTTSEVTSTTACDMRHTVQSDHGSGRGADERLPTTPSSGHPPAFVPSPYRQPMVLSPEIREQDLPATPLTPSSGSVRHRPHHQSQISLQSFTSSISPALSPASFNTADPPPWAVPHEQGMTRGGTVVPESHQVIRVDINKDPGRMVPSNLGGFDLCMHKGDSKTVPSYGRGESVSGYVDLKVFDHIAEIEVTMQGTLQVVYSERGLAYDEANITLFTETRTLFTSAWGRAPGQSHPFKFEFPGKCVASDTALPPTWSLIRAGVSAEVSYIIRATLKRKGMFKKCDKASTKVEYYPRTAPPLPEPVSPNGTRKPKSRVFEMEHYLRPTGPSAVNRPMVPTTFTTRISLRLPLTYASGSNIPYTVSLSSPVGTSVPVSLDVQVSLIKTSKVVVKKNPYEKKDVVAQGTNVDKQFELGHRRANTNSHEPNEGSTVTIKGMIVAGGVGHEMSWGVEGVATIMYALRFLVIPTQKLSEFPNFKDTLPTFEHSVEIMLTTDETATLLSDTEARLPARGLGHGRTRSNTDATGLTQTSSRNSSNSGELASMGMVGSHNVPTSPTRDSLHGARRITSRPHTSSGPLF